MMKNLIYIFLFAYIYSQTNTLTINDIIAKMDQNLTSKNRILKSKMIVYGRRTSRTIESKSWISGKQSFTEYLSKSEIF